MRRRSRTPVWRCVTRCSPSAYRSSRCISPTSSPASRSGGGLCSRIWRWGWWRGSAPTVIGWDSKHLPGISSRPLAPDRRPERHAALAAMLDAEGLDALLVTSRPNIRYLTGFSGSAGVVVATPGTLVLVTDFRYEEQARQESAAVARVEIEGTSVWDRLFKELGAGVSGLAPGGTIGFEAHTISVKDAERFSTGPGTAWRWKVAGELVERLRVRKDAGEVADIRAAAALAAMALRDTLAEGRAGQTELEIAGALEGALRRHGSEAHPFPTIGASGPRSALPHAQTSTRTGAG